MLSALHLKRSSRRVIVGVMFSVFGSIAAHAEKVLHDFSGGTDGIAPQGALIADGSGNLFGTTRDGGGGTGCNNDSSGCGTVFQVAPSGAESVLYAFKGGNDGTFPGSALVVDSTGNYYGTTYEGGNHGCGAVGCGTVFKLAPNGTEAVLYAFTGGSDGNSPEGDRLAIDDNGNLYGTTFVGGNLQDCSGQGCGTVFEVPPGGGETVLYAFQGGSDGAGPASGVIRDDNGNLYGTTSQGGGCGAVQTGCGTIYKLAPDGTETVLYAFRGGQDGEGPRGALLMEQSGNFYGTTFSGGDPVCGCGTVFELPANGPESVLYAFKGRKDGSVPLAGVIMDTGGNLYGTTFQGGGTGCRRTGGCGTVFKLDPNSRERVLYTFHLKGGQNPAASPLLIGDKLYGTTTGGGGRKDGVVFKIEK